MSTQDSQPQPPRLTSLDAYRGFVMLAMASSGLGFRQVAGEFPDSEIWQELGRQFRHVEWAGCVVWDLIQPAFMFMVGVALPFSFAARKARGHSYGKMWAHAMVRSVILILLGIFIFSNYNKQTNFTFVCVLTQIGLGYPFLFLLVNRGVLIQLLAVTAILGGYWLWFYLYPPDVLDPKLLVAHTRDSFSGFFAHWNIHTNAAAGFDRWFLNLFPRPEPFVVNSGGYHTLNFIPSLATMILGLMGGEMLRRDGSSTRKTLKLFLDGALCLVIGLILGEVACPVVKKIWTPSWVFFSAGWVLWMLAAFYCIIEVLGWRRWAFPLVVVGMNSIAMYCLANLMGPWIEKSLHIHLDIELFDGPYGPIVESVSVLAVLWLIVFWMYRRKLFLRV